MRVAIANESGDILQPPINRGFPQVFINPPEEILMKIAPKTGKIGLNAKGRWR